MYLTYLCPQCNHSNQSDRLSEADQLRCERCDWNRTIAAVSDSQISGCVRCGNPDLWRQKNFPQGVGLLIVAAGAVLSGIAWAYYLPLVAFGILMFVALLDMVLYAVMADVLVCYRCRTRHHQADVSGHASFDHELAEKYRQEEIRLRESVPPPERQLN